MAQSILDLIPETCTGTLTITEHLNFWGGKRVKPLHETNVEPVFEPATGEKTQLLIHKLLCGFSLQDW